MCSALFNLVEVLERKPETVSPTRRRVQAPVSDHKWRDEWSTEQLDWIRPSEAVALANEVGGVSQVGWWFSHGNMIE